MSDYTNIFMFFDYIFQLIMYKMMVEYNCDV